MLSSLGLTGGRDSDFLTFHQPGDRNPVRSGAARPRAHSTNEARTHAHVQNHAGKERWEIHGGNVSASEIMDEVPCFCGTDAVPEMVRYRFNSAFDSNAVMQ